MNREGPSKDRINEMTRNNAIDALLVMRCQDGSADALDELVRRWQRPLWRYALGLTGRSDEAWEVIQEAWLGIVRGLGHLRDPALFRPWAYRIVRNRAASWVARVQRARARESEVEPDRIGSEGTGSRDHGLRAAISRLPENQRAVLTLHYLDEMPVREIAAALLIPPGTVKSRLHTARRRLREIMERESHA